MANGVAVNDMSTMPDGLPPSQVSPICTAPLTMDWKTEPTQWQDKLCIPAHIGSQYVQLPPSTDTSHWSSINYIKCFTGNTHVTAQ